MLSESTRGSVEYGPLLVRLIHMRGRKARTTAIAVGVALIATLAVLMIWLPPDLSLTALFLLPVVVVSWWAGGWAGVWAAVAASATRLLVDLTGVTEPSSPFVPYGNFAIGLAMYLVVARVLPGLRETAFRDREQAITDPLTNLGNRRLFGEVASIELNRTRRYRRPLVLAYLNVDAFEKFNERHGYAEGDALLVLIASMVRGCLRASDVVARIAADEFAVLLPETHAEGARVAVEKIHENLRGAAQDAGYAVTFSVAVVTFEEGGVALDAMLRQADALMQAVKREGGNAIRYEEYAHPVLAAL